ncbi:hypothetical protein Pmar_PMAR000645 [Perkinsus marinus ATCC 50983]|uniref:Uncharacterized protein n=1 Tax=Perkinsus marinus (strain ATCC 50983 / TXsc) TaxID=423536 RepID=C5KRD9_PERM5|nr:hypothetical protein Pmar_PMAR000645 [Perkinsus marinus ATCC 50983]EER12912.1 hypothetical protein Pmar_PMAR000645 [Perkinsus marinus ATCC 50983]|eukprot:XP_002781117.1 hypothetical protein Pmar_PMAR000645 [Perkinsus marinus ATCC 50983]
MASGYYNRSNEWQIVPGSSCAVMEVDDNRPGKRKFGDADGPAAAEFAAGISSVVSSCSSASTCPSPMALCGEQQQQDQEVEENVKRVRTGEAPESAHRNPYEVINAMLRSANDDKQRRAEEAAECERLRVEQYWVQHNRWLQRNFSDLRQSNGHQ